LTITGQSQVSLGVGAQFTCWADATASSYTVPAAVMAAMPPTYSDSNVAQGGLTVGQSFTGPGFTAPGLDYTYAQIGDSIGIGPVAYQ
jgi:hypothetical protein